MCRAALLLVALVVSSCSINPQPIPPKDTALSAPADAGLPRGSGAESQMPPGGESPSGPTQADASVLATDGAPQDRDASAAAAEGGRDAATDAQTAPD